MDQVLLMNYFYYKIENFFLCIHKTHVQRQGQVKSTIVLICSHISEKNISLLIYKHHLDQFHMFNIILLKRKKKSNLNHYKNQNKNSYVNNYIKDIWDCCSYLPLVLLIVRWLSFINRGVLISWQAYQKKKERRRILNNSRTKTANLSILMCFLKVFKKSKGTRFFYM